MANRETYPASLFPLRGDLSAEAGATTVKVIGLQGTPLSMLPVEKINGSGVSFDFMNLVNTAIVINYGANVYLGNKVNGTNIP